MEFQRHAVVELLAELEMREMSPVRMPCRFQMQLDVNDCRHWGADMIRHSCLIASSLQFLETPQGSFGLVIDCQW